MAGLLQGRPGAAGLVLGPCGAASLQCSTSYGSRSLPSLLVPTACAQRGAPQVAGAAGGAGSRRSLLQLAVGSAVGARTGLRAAVAMESAPLELSSLTFGSFQQEGSPKCHVGPPVFVQATGRIIASACGGGAAGARGCCWGALLVPHLWSPFCLGWACSFSCCRPRAARRLH